MGVVEMVAAIITSFLAGAFSGVVYAFFFVTIVFACIEYFVRKKGVSTWSPKNLPEIPAASKSGIKRADTIAEAVFSILFTTIFLAGTLRNPPFIAWYEAGQSAAPLFELDIVRQFLPLYLILIALMLFLMFFKLVKDGGLSASRRRRSCLPSSIRLSALRLLQD